MTDRRRRRTASPLRLVRDGDPAEPTDAPVAVATLEALLLAQQGYQAAVDAAGGATVPSLTDFVD